MIELRQMSPFGQLSPARVSAHITNTGAHRLGMSRDIRQAPLLFGAGANPRPGTTTPVKRASPLDHGFSHPHAPSNETRDDQGDSRGIVSRSDPTTMFTGTTAGEAKPNTATMHHGGDIGCDGTLLASSVLTVCAMTNHRDLLTNNPRSRLEIT